MEKCPMNLILPNPEAHTAETEFPTVLLKKFLLILYLSWVITEKPVWIQDLPWDLSSCTISIMLCPLKCRILLKNTGEIPKKILNSPILLRLNRKILSPF